MTAYRVTSWGTFLAVTVLVACGDAPPEPASYEPTPARLVGEFSGNAGEGLETYNLFLAIDQVGDSVRGQWSLSFQATCSTHDGPFSGVLEGDRLEIGLRPDEDYEVTLDLSVQVLPGDSVLSGEVTLVAPGIMPPNYEGPVLCGSDQLAPITLHQGEIEGLPRMP